MDNVMVYLPWVLLFFTSTGLLAAVLILRTMGDMNFEYFTGNCRMKGIIERLEREIEVLKQERGTSVLPCVCNPHKTEINGLARLPLADGSRPDKCLMINDKFFAYQGNSVYRLEFDGQDRAFWNLISNTSRIPSVDEVIDR